MRLKMRLKLHDKAWVQSNCKHVRDYYYPKQDVDEQLVLWDGEMYNKLTGKTVEAEWIRDDWFALGYYIPSWLIETKEDKGMMFDKSKVYCVWDDCLKGKNVIVADSIESLKRKVTANYKVTSVTWDDTHSCFVAEHGVVWNFAYLLDTYYVVLGGNEFVYTTTPNDRHVFAVFDSVDEAADWCIKHDKFAKVAQAWLDGKEIQFRSENTKNWTEASAPCWGLEYEYRVKPAVKAKVGKIYWNKAMNRTAMCIAIDTYDTDMPVNICDRWYSEEEFANDWREVED